MPIDRGVAAKALSWLKGKIPPICPTCYSTKGFYISDPVAAPLVHLETGEIQWGQEIPMLPVLCKNCGHIRFFSTEVMGLVRRSQSPAASPAPPGVATGSPP